jgi:DNA polymerase III gamma/tau subunit
VLAFATRPQVLEDIIGHVESVRYIRSQIAADAGANRSGRSVVFAGQSGDGVSTVAWMYAKALCCPALDAPCGKPSSDACNRFESS